MSPYQLSRRDFLKLLALTPAALAVEPLAKHLPQAGPAAPHIIILIFDAWAAENTSLYGYPRLTMPNLELFSRNATVYQRHYSTATFTIPGTASLLTGLYPWQHRATALGGEITPSYAESQIFAALAKTHNTLGYSQNIYSDLFLYQAGKFLQTHLPNGSFNLNHSLLYSLPLFKKDAYLAFSSLEDNIIQRGLGQDASLVLGPLYRFLSLRDKFIKTAGVSGDYANGLPDSLEAFTLPGVVAGVIDVLSALQEPSLVYLHLFPPHDPYRPTNYFGQQFQDNWLPAEKPIHPMAEGKFEHVKVQQSRLRYDQFLANWDAELKDLFIFFETSGLLEKSYLFITSDHGEMFERGEIGHSTSLLYEPLLRVPLIVRQPGQKQRIDVTIPTTSLDILPTIAHLTNNPRPAWAEGELLPALGGTENPTRTIYALDARSNSAFARLSKFSIALTQGDYRLTYYQYANYTSYEFYDLATDPEEIKDLYASRPAALRPLQDELSALLDQIALAAPR